MLALFASEHAVKDAEKRKIEVHNFRFMKSSMTVQLKSIEQKGDEKNKCDCRVSLDNFFACTKGSINKIGHVVDQTSCCPL